MVLACFLTHPPLLYFSLFLKKDLSMIHQRNNDHEIKSVLYRVYSINLATIIKSF